MAVGLNVKYRDVRYTMPFLTQFWMFATPVAYPSSLVPGAVAAFYGLNPMVGVVEGFRWALLGNGSAPRADGRSCPSSRRRRLLIGGLFYFRRTERTFADSCDCMSAVRDHGSKALGKRVPRSARRERYGALRDSLATRAAPRP